MSFVGGRTWSKESNSLKAEINLIRYWHRIRTEASWNDSYNEILSEHLNSFIVALPNPGSFMLIECDDSVKSIDNLQLESAAIRLVKMIDGDHDSVSKQDLFDAFSNFISELRKKNGSSRNYYID